MSGSQVDFEQARAHADKAVEATQHKILELRVGVEQRQIQPDSGSAQGSLADVVIEIEAGALALELERAAVVGHELVGEQTGRDGTDQPDVPEREKDRATEAPRGEIAADQRVLVLRVNHVGAVTTRLVDERAIEAQVEPRADEASGGRERGARRQPAPNGELNDAWPRPIMPAGSAPARRDDCHRVPAAGERLGEELDRPGAAAGRERRIVFRRKQDLHRTEQTA